MSFFSDFRAFIVRGNIIDLAVAVVMGAAFGKIVDALVTGVVMPIIGALLPSKGWEGWTVTSLQIKLGLLLKVTIEFVVIGLVVFIVVKKLMGRMQRDVPGPAIKECPECLEKIPAAARRCRACTTAFAG